jgi:ClpX C4-type zinc finger
MPKPAAGKNKQLVALPGLPITCLFCFKGPSEAEFIIVGQHPSVGICSECVAISADAIAERRARKRSRTAGRRRSRKPSWKHARLGFRSRLRRAEPGGSGDRRGRRRDLRHVSRASVGAPGPPGRRLIRAPIAPGPVPPVTLAASVAPLLCLRGRSPASTNRAANLRGCQ